MKAWTFFLLGISVDDRFRWDDSVVFNLHSHFSIKPLFKQNQLQIEESWVRIQLRAQGYNRLKVYEYRLCRKTYRLFKAQIKSLLKP